MCGNALVVGGTSGKKKNRTITDLHCGDRENVIEGM